MRKAVVSLSGGVDSAVTLAVALKDGYTCQGVGFRYGSKHNRYENKAAKAVAEAMGVPFHLLDLKKIFEGFPSSLMQASDEEIPEGHYEEDSMKSTVVPSRNIIFASILSGYAQSVGAEQVWLGIHAGDHFIYPDCRPEFFEAMSKAVELGTDMKVALVAPFLHNNKVDIVKRGFLLDVHFELTRTCYKAQKIACGKCGSCVERLEAFRESGLKDPISYEKD